MADTLFSTAFAKSPLALTVTSLEDGRLVEVNEGFERLTGYTRAEVIGKSPDELNLWVEPVIRSDRFAQLQAGMAVPDVEARFRIKDGNILIGVIGSAVVEIDGRLCVLSSVMDITERKRAEQTLRESEAWFRQMADAAPVLIWRSGPDGSCTWFNRPWLEFVGRPMEHELGEGWVGNVHPGDRERRLRVYRESFDARQAFAIEYRLRRHDGQDRWVLDHGTPLFGRAGELTGYIGSCIDITDRKEMEDALTDADRRKDEFLAMLAHELRNPLAPIRSALEVLRLLGVSAPQQRRAYDVIERQASHLSRVVDDLLDVSRITQGKILLQRERLDLATVVDRAIEASMPLIAARQHQLQVSLPEPPVFLDGDPMRLVQVLSNLLNNAAKFTPDGGGIQIEAALEDGEAVLRVRDDGMGIPADLLPRVFDVFVQADRSLDRTQSGLGIGLTLVRTIVSLHGGTVAAHSEGSGLGAEFVVRLPAAASRSAPSPEPAARPAGVALRILVVEDNRDAADMLAMMLALNGHDVRIAPDGRSAVAEAAGFGPDVVLCDIGLPGMDGYEVASRLRQQSALARTRLVAVSGYGQDRDRERATAAGFDEHLTKPVEPDVLLALIDVWASARPTK